MVSVYCTSNCNTCRYCLKVGAWLTKKNGEVLHNDFILTQSDNDEALIIATIVGALTFLNLSGTNTPVTIYLPQDFIGNLDNNKIDENLIMLKDLIKKFESITFKALDPQANDENSEVYLTYEHICGFARGIALLLQREYLQYHEQL